jgi:hypothetical protein
MPYKTYEELVAEAGAYTPPPQGREFYNPLTQRRKSPERYIADQRRLYVLERLKDVESGAPNILDPAPLRRQLASPIEPYAKPGFSYFDKDKGGIVEVPGQYLGEDSPAWKALTWMGSPVSAVANASRALANQADRAVSYAVGQEPAEQYPGAWRKANTDFGTFVSAIPRKPMAVVHREGEEPQRPDTRWQELREMREVQDQGPYRDIDPRRADLAIQGTYAPEQIDMVDLYEDTGLLPPNAAWALGTVGNIVTDPGAAMLSVPSLVKQGMKPAAWRALGFDVATGVAPEVLIQTPGLYRQAMESDVAEKIRELLPGRY